jgi:hypothetical protein
MNVEDDSGAIADGIRAMRVVHGTLMAGAFTFLLIVVAIKWGSKPAGDGQLDPVMLTLMGQSVLTLLLGWFYPRGMVAKRRSELVQSLDANGGQGAVSASDLMNVLRGTSILRLALWESTVFTTLICMVITGQQWLLWFALAVLLLMAWGWPTVPSVTRWVLEQRELIRQES